MKSETLISPSFILLSANAQHSRRNIRGKISILFQCTGEILPSQRGTVGAVATSKHLDMLAHVKDTVTLAIL